jgi:hypothetical protein
MAYANVHGAAPSAYAPPHARGPAPMAYAPQRAPMPPAPHPPHSAHPPHPPHTALEARRLSALIGAAGAILSIALVCGVGWWSYRLMVRDVSGIPVVRALEGPMRVAAADPGGRQTAFQGLAVNAVPATGATAARPAEIALAPAPIDLAPEDRLRPAAPPPAAAAPVIAPVTAPAPSATDQALALALASPSADAGPLPPGTPGVARSPVPPPRSARLSAPAAVAQASGGATNDRAAEAALAEIATRLAAPRATEIAPASLTPGTRLVQLGAYETDAEARRAWDDLAARFPAYLDGRARVIEPATAGGRVFFRLRAHGFRDEPEARRFCSVFVTEDLECTPVLIR